MSKIGQVLPRACIFRTDLLHFARNFDIIKAFYRLFLPREGSWDMDEHKMSSQSLNPQAELLRLLYKKTPQISTEGKIDLASAFKNDDQLKTNPILQMESEDMEFKVM